MIKKLITGPDEIKKVYEFIKQFPLDYPDYGRWLEKMKRELELRYKSGFFVTNKKGVIGSIIFQPHKQDSSVLELKNLRVLPSYEKKGIGAKLLKLAEDYAIEKGFKKLQGDAHEDNFKVIRFMLKHGFRRESKENLYLPSKIEVILSKEI